MSISSKSQHIKSNYYLYDEIGNLVQDEGLTYTWTNAQKLESVQILSDYSLDFKYDAL